MTNKTSYRNDKKLPMVNGVKSERELLKSRLQKLLKLLDYKNRKYCKKHLKETIKLL